MEPLLSLALLRGRGESCRPLNTQSTPKPIAAPAKAPPVAPWVPVHWAAGASHSPSSQRWPSTPPRTAPTTAPIAPRGMPLAESTRAESATPRDRRRLEAPLPLRARAAEMPAWLVHCASERVDHAMESSKQTVDNRHLLIRTKVLPKKWREIIKYLQLECAMARPAWLRLDARYVSPCPTVMYG